MVSIKLGWVAMPIGYRFDWVFFTFNEEKTSSSRILCSLLPTIHENSYSAIVILLNSREVIQRNCGKIKINQGTVFPTGAFI